MFIKFLLVAIASCIWMAAAGYANAKFKQVNNPNFSSDDWLALVQRLMLSPLILAVDIFLILEITSSYGIVLGLLSIVLLGLMNVGYAAGGSICLRRKTPQSS